MSSNLSNNCSTNRENTQQKGIEHQPSKLRVAGSSPAAPTKTKALTATNPAAAQSEPQLFSPRCSDSAEQLQDAQNWQAGDRVYSVSMGWPGTVRGVTGGEGRIAQVEWDGGYTEICLSSDLDWYTRPPTSSRAGQG